MPRSLLLCTVGTSLLNPNSAGGQYTTRGATGPVTDWNAVTSVLRELPVTDRACGAEMNSVAALVAVGHAAVGCGVYLFHSDTDDGRAIAAALADLFRFRGHSPVEAVCVTDLQDTDPTRFASRGLPNLARAMAGAVRNHGPGATAINATGGFKAQTAVAVLTGQALGVPVHYLHEKFGTPITFPVIAAADLSSEPGSQS